MNLTYLVWSKVFLFLIFRVQLLAQFSFLALTVSVLREKGSSKIPEPKTVILTSHPLSSLKAASEMLHWQTIIISAVSFQTDIASIQVLDHSVEVV